MKKQVSNQDAYNVFLNSVLAEKLFESAIELHEMLVEKFNVSATNARQIVKRAVAAKSIKSSAPYTFGKGQFVYIYNEHDFGKGGIKKISEKSRPPIYRLLELMDLNGGIISYYEALKITSAPLEESSTKVVSLDDILTLLMKMEIVCQKKDSNDVVYIIYKVNSNEQSDMFDNAMMAEHYNKMVTDCSVLPDILRWLGNANLIEYTNVIYRNKKTPHIGAKHNNLVWDAFAYTKATGINPILGAKAESIEKQTLVVLDVVLSSEYSAIYLDAFIGRIQINRMSVIEGSRKIMPIIIYKECTAHTLNTIKKNGIIAFDVSAIFGTKIYDVLNRVRELSILLSQKDRIEETIEGILNTISNAGQEEALKELRGTLFEFLLYPLLATIYPNANIERGKTITKLDENGEKESYEYDYIIESGNPAEIIFVELKGYHSGATIALGSSEEKATLKWFFRKTLPFAIKDYKAVIEKGKSPKAIFITSANFWDDGQEFIKKMDKSKFKSVHLNTGYDRERLLALLKKYGFKTEIRIIKRFYSKPGPINFEEQN